MKRYRVAISVKDVWYYDVSADNPEEAERIAENLNATGGSEADYWESPCTVDSVEEIKS